MVQYLMGFQNQSYNLCFFISMSSCLATNDCRTFCMDRNQRSYENRPNSRVTSRPLASKHTFPQNNTGERDFQRKIMLLDKYSHVFMNNIQDVEIQIFGSFFFISLTFYKSINKTRIFFCPLGTLRKDSQPYERLVKKI